MRMSVEKKVSELTEMQKKLSLWYKIVLLLACFVVVITTYVLIVPAMTMESDYICGKTAHVHTEDCEAVDEEGHKTLTCDMEEHIHDENCLVHTERATSPYDCGYEYEHTHGPECYVAGELVCTMDEHTHAQSCLKQTPAVRAGAEAEPEESAQEEAASEPAADTLTEEAPETAEETGEEPEAEPVTEAATEAPAEEETEAPTEEETEAITEEETEAPTEEAEEPAEPTEEASEEVTEEVTEETTAEAEELVTEESAFTDLPVEEDPTDAEDVTEPETEAETEAPSEEATDEPTEEETEALSEEELPDVELTEEVTEDPLLAELDPSTMRAKDIIAVSELEKLMCTESLRIYRKIYDENNNPINMDVDLDILDGGKYYFELRLNKFAENMQDYNFNGHTIYYYDLKLPNQLRAPALDSKYTENFAPINDNSSALMYFEPIEGGLRIYFLISAGEVVEVFMEGNAEGVNDGDDNALEVDKEGVFDPVELAFEYTIDTPIPAAVDNYQQIYRMWDTTTVAGHSFNPFEVNEIQVSYSQNGGQTYQPMPKLSDVTDSDTLAYRISSDYQIEFFNRIPAEKQKYIISSSKTEKVGEDWYNVWAQTKVTDVRVTYLDTYTRDHMSYNLPSNERFKGELTNVAYLNGTMHGVTENLDGLISKKLDQRVDDGKGNQFNVLINEAGYNLGSRELKLEDNMTSCRLLFPEDGSDPIRVYRIIGGTRYTLGKNAYEIDLHYNDNGEVTSFTLTIYEAGSYTYDVVYKIAKTENDTGGQFTNIAHFFGTELGEETSGYYQEESIDYSDLAISFEVDFEKEYEQYAPAQGATFEVSRVSASGRETPVLESYTRASDGGEIHNQRMVRSLLDESIEPYIIGAYTPGDPTSENPVKSETITFDSKHFGLFSKTLYVIRETKAPEGFDLSQEPVYFYFFFDEDDDFSIIPSYITDRDDVHILKNFEDWQLLTEDGVQYLFAEQHTGETITNSLKRYELPETGGTGILRPAVTGIGLLAFSGMLSTGPMRRREDRQEI